MTFYRLNPNLADSLDQIPAAVSYPAVLTAGFISLGAPLGPSLSLSEAMQAPEGMAGAHVNAAPEALQAASSPELVTFEQLPDAVIQQLRSDGTRGEWRDLEGAREVFEHSLPDSAKVSIEAVEAITNDPDIHWMHIVPHAAGGGTEASNGVYGPAELNHAIGSRTMTAEEVELAMDYTDQIAHRVDALSDDLDSWYGYDTQTQLQTSDASTWDQQTWEQPTWEPPAQEPQTTVALQMLPLSAAMAGGLAMVHRWAQVEGFRSVGRQDLAQAAEQQLLRDGAKGAVNGLVRGSSVLLTQAVLGAHPLSAGLGLVAPDAIRLLARQGELSEAERQRHTLALVGKGALATALICTGPLGWLGLTGLSVAMAYSGAASQGQKRLLPAA